MKLVYPLLMAITLALGACAAPAPAPTEPPPPVAGETRYESMAAATAAAKDGDVICSYEEVLGSRFRQRVCATRQEREQAAARSKEELQRSTGRGAAITSR